MPVDIYRCEYNTKPNSGDNMDFIVKGTFKAGEKWEGFTKTVKSQNKMNATEKTYS